MTDSNFMRAKLRVTGNMQLMPPKEAYEQAQHFAKIFIEDGLEHGARIHSSSIYSMVVTMDLSCTDPYVDAFLGTRAECEDHIVQLAEQYDATSPEYSKKLLELLD